jgi:hypothetical protein
MCCRVISRNGHGPPPPDPARKHSYRSAPLHSVSGRPECFRRLENTDTSGADPDPGSGLSFFRILDPGSQTHIIDSLMTNFG